MHDRPPAPPDQSTWSRIAPWLDRALDLPPHERDAWLATLTRTDPQIVHAVREMLSELDALNARGFLAQSAPTPQAQRSWAGTCIGAYTLTERIGLGGMGEVWLASRSDGRYEGRAAVKLLNAALLGQPAEQRFIREGSLLARLRHPNIAHLIDAGATPDGQPYLVLEYVEGERIDQYAEHRALDLESRIRLFLHVLAAVAHAHSHLVVHRDLKPTNILVTPQGDAKLLDFGIAALLGPVVAELTRESDPALTPGYAAPEQLLGRPVTTATDVHALGVVLYLLLTGKHPFQRGDSPPRELMRLTLENQPELPSTVAPDPRRARALRGDLDNIVAKALRKDPEERYPTAVAFAADLQRFLEHKTISARPDSVTYRARRFVRRNRTALAVGTITFIALLGATILTTMLMLEARRQRDVALYESQRAEFQSRFAYQIMSEVGDGGPITIRELMKKGIEVLERNYGDDPRFVIGMLVNISGRYMDLGDTEGELAALVKAERIARALGDPDRIAFVQCNTVETELAAGKPQRADERLRDGLANLAQVPTPSFQRLRECGLAEARLRWAQGDLDAGIAAATRVIDGMHRRHETSQLNYGTATSMLAVMLGEDGRHREALEWNERLAQAHDRAGRGGTMSHILTRHREAGIRYELGAPLAALQIQRAIVKQISDQQGASGVPTRLFTRLGLYSVRVEQTAAGLDDLERGLAAMSPQEPRAYVPALLERASANLWLGRLEAVTRDLEQAEQLLAATTTDRQEPARLASLLRAQVELERGRPASALPRLDALLREVGYPASRIASRLPLILTEKSRAELALNQPAAAVGTAISAVEVAESMSLDPRASATVGAALMALAEGQRVLGESSNARSTARRAAAAFAVALGPDHPETRSAAQFD